VINNLDNKQFCLFHDETYLKDIKEEENRDNVIEKLINERIDSSNNNNEPILFIGYNLPDIVINKEFIQPVYFIHTRFRRITFNSATFSSFLFNLLINFCCCIMANRKKR
jgi:hypothetical protein